jgi:GNAT superfamily N-acetyltransferase
MKIQVRVGQETDLPKVYDMIKALADYEKAPDEVEITIERLSNDLKNNLFGFYVAEYDGDLCGMALYYYRYSTWKGKCLYLEDLYVYDAYRKFGLGSALFEEMLRHAQKNHCYRISWQVLEWNEPAIQRCLNP